MEPITIFDLKLYVADEKYDLVSNEFWNKIIKVFNANLFVNVNDKYVVLYNDSCEMHLNCIAGIYKDNGTFIIEIKHILNESITETYKLTKHNNNIN